MLTDEELQARLRNAFADATGDLHAGDGLARDVRTAAARRAPRLFAVGGGIAVAAAAAVTAGALLPSGSPSSAPAGGPVPHASASAPVVGGGDGYSASYAMKAFDALPCLSATRAGKIPGQVFPRSEGSKVLMQPTGVPAVSQSPESVPTYCVPVVVGLKRPPRAAGTKPGAVEIGRPSGALRTVRVYDPKHVRPDRGWTVLTFSARATPAQIRTFVASLRMDVSQRTGSRPSSGPTR